jgi:DNA-binding CsgD family transcriptional regulator
MRLFSFLAPHLQRAHRIIQRVASLEATLDRLVAGDLDTKALARLELTPAESRVAVALFKGLSVEEYAKEAGVSINTARTLVRRVYAKTGVTRQAELIHALLKTTASTL